jgi:hypothetical protein
MTTIKDKNEFRDKIIKGLELCYANLLIKKKQTNGQIAVIKDGKVVLIKPD